MIYVGENSFPAIFLFIFPHQYAPCSSPGMSFYLERRKITFPVIRETLAWGIWNHPEWWYPMGWDIGIWQVLCEGKIRHWEQELLEKESLSRKLTKSRESLLPIKFQEKDSDRCEGASRFELCQYKYLHKRACIVQRTATVMKYLHIYKYLDINKPARFISCILRSNPRNGRGET